MKVRRALIVTIVALLVGIAPLAAHEEAACKAGFHLFEHEYLEGDPVCIPENPQRILALELSALESVLELGDKAETPHLVLFHHDPDRTDDALDAVGARARAHIVERRRATLATVAFEGLILSLDKGVEHADALAPTPFAPPVDDGGLTRGPGLGSGPALPPPKPPVIT